MTSQNLRAIGSLAKALLLLCGIVPVAGHGYVSFPTARNIGNGVKNGYCQHCGNGNTNVCGDGNQWPSGSEYYKYTQGPMSRLIGNILQIEITITAHHKGHFEFSICDRQINGGTGLDNQDCLNKYLLRRVPPNVTNNDCRVNDPRGECQPYDDLHPERFYLPPPGTGMTSQYTTTYSAYDVHQMHFYLPEGLTCQGKCTLQWRWWTANSCTPKPDYGCYFDKMKALGWNSKQWCGSFCGTCQKVESAKNTYQRGCGEEFANCADITLGGGGPVPTPAPGGGGSPVPTPAPVRPTLPPRPPTPAPTPTPSRPTYFPSTTTPPTTNPPGTECYPIPGNNAGATVQNCKACGEGSTIWPCNTNPPICDCSAPTPAPTPAPTSGAPNLKCKACLNAHPTAACVWSDGMCYPTTESVCTSQPGATWCPSSALLQGHTEPVKMHKVKVRRHLRRRRQHDGEHDDASMMQVPLGMQDADELFDEEFTDEEDEGREEL